MFGDGTGEEVRIRFMDAAAERALALNAELYAGELFTDGRLVVDQGTIFDFLALVLRDPAPLSLPMRLLKNVRMLKRRFISRNNPWRARRNVAHHYDLDRRLYSSSSTRICNTAAPTLSGPTRRWRRPSLPRSGSSRQSSCSSPTAAFSTSAPAGADSGSTSRRSAARGCARHHAYRPSNSASPRARARARASKTRVRFALQDYRDVKGTFDRIVSVGMFEHVGTRFYETYFGKCRELLKPDGVMLVHTIGLMDGPGTPTPGSTSTSSPAGSSPHFPRSSRRSSARGSSSPTSRCLRLHYAETLANGAARFMARRAEAAALYDERFCRMWEYYLAGCEAAFRFQDVAVFQVQCARRGSGAADPRLHRRAHARLAHS